METIDYRNLQLKRFNSKANTEAAIITHGGYTPAKGIFHKGSGTTHIPIGITVEMYAPADTVCVGTNAYWKVSTGSCTNAPAETLNQNDITENYSLEHDEKTDAWSFNDEWKMDIFLVTKKKAHLTDIWDFIRTHNLPYTKIHAFFCRVNKTTFAGNVS